MGFNIFQHTVLYNFLLIVTISLSILLEALLQNIIFLCKGGERKVQEGNGFERTWTQHPRQAFRKIILSRLTGGMPVIIILELWGKGKRKSRYLCLANGYHTFAKHSARSSSLVAHFFVTMFCAARSLVAILCVLLMILSLVHPHNGWKLIKRELTFRCGKGGCCIPIAFPSTAIRTFEFQE